MLDTVIFQPVFLPLGHAVPELWSEPWIQAPCFGWASGKQRPSKGFQKAFLIFLPERGVTAAQTKHQIQSWSTSKPPLLYVLSVLCHRSFHTPFPQTQLHPTVSSSFPWPCISLFIHWLSTAVAVLPPSSSFSLLIPLLLSVCGLLLNRRSSTGNWAEQPAMLMRRKEEERGKSRREEIGLGWGVGGLTTPPSPSSSSEP